MIFYLVSVWYAAKSVIKKYLLQISHLLTISGNIFTPLFVIFQEENGKVNQLKLLDHQMIRNSTPVHDLSYFFYSAASEKDFKQLDDYLHIYYTAFNRHLQEFGVNSDNAVQWSSFKEDWRNYALLGISMGLIVWPAKLMNKETVQSLADAENMHDAFAVESKNIMKGNRFKVVATDLVEHAFEYGIL